MTTYPMSPEDREIQERTRRFVDEELIPWEEHAEEHDGLIPEDTRARHYRLVRELGLFAMNMPKDLGGGGFTMLQQVLVSEQIGRVTNALGLISYRRGAGVVTGTGIRTQLGQIAGMLRSFEAEDTPLQIKLDQLGKSLGYGSLAICAVVFGLGLFRGQPLLEMFLTAVSLAIAAVPEGLLIAVTVILVLGMRKILKRKGLVKRLLAVEALGSVTVICTDKTGTLTEGRMRVSRSEILDSARALQTMVLCNDLEGPVDIALWEHARQLLNGDPQGLVDQSKRLEVVRYKGLQLR